jgi:SM-20-related protein
MNSPSYLNLDALRAANVSQQPFPYLIVPGFVRAEALAGIEKDYPSIDKPGSFPLDTLQYGPAFTQLMDDLRSPEFRDVVASKLGLDLKGKPTMITVRGQARARDGQIHTDSKTKIVTVLLYMNGQWEAPGGRLRLLKSPDNLNDVVAEVPPEQGTLLVFLNTPNAYHGHEPFEGQRRSIQLNWVTGQGVVWREQVRHRISAFFKRLKKAA